MYIYIQYITLHTSSFSVDPIYPGLENVDSRCFLNSVLQALRACQELQHELQFGCTTPATCRFCCLPYIILYYPFLSSGTLCASRPSPGAFLFSWCLYTLAACRVALRVLLYTGCLSSCTGCLVIHWVPVVLPWVSCHTLGDCRIVFFLHFSGYQISEICMELHHYCD